MKISLASLEINYICFIKTCILYVLRLFALYILDWHICILFPMHLLLVYGHFICNAPFVSDNLVKGGWHLAKYVEDHGPRVGWILMEKPTSQYLIDWLHIGILRGKGI